MKILISSCILGQNVRWNGSNKTDEDLIKWAKENDIELVPVCPENELFGTPRAPIRLIDVYGKIQAQMRGEDVMAILDSKCQEIFKRYPDAVGFIGIANSPSCGVNVGVKGHGKTTKGSMHKISKISTIEINQLKNHNQRVIFLSRLNKHGNKSNKKKD